MPQKGTSTLRMRVCRQCGIEFMGGQRAWYCPSNDLLTDMDYQDGSRNGFYIQKAANLGKVLFAFDEGESDGGLYAPHIAEITEAEFNNFPHFIPQNWVYGAEF